MAETKKELKDRLQAAGLWQGYLAVRDRLKADGVAPAQAREQALRQVEARPPDPAAPPTPDQPHDDAPVEDEYPNPPPMCPCCERLAQRVCGDCLEREYLAYAAWCERRGLDAMCRRCRRQGTRTPDGTCGAEEPPADDAPAARAIPRRPPLCARCAPYAGWVPGCATCDWRLDKDAVAPDGAGA